MNPINLFTRRSTFFVTLALLVGCGSGTGSVGGAGGTSETSSTTATSATGSGGMGPGSGGTGSGGTGSGGTGSGGMGGAKPDLPTLGMTKVGNPLWEIVDYHQFAAPVGDKFENFHDIQAGVLPPPNHKDHPDLGIGPGDPHAGPYTGEFAAGVLAKGYIEHETYTKAEGSIPNAIISPFMVVPSAGAPTGKSPDGASTPIIPNTIFPITVTSDTYEAGTLLDGYSYTFDVPALDKTLDPPFDVDGHSHFPIFNASYFDGMPTIPGTIETHMSLIDSNGDGWDLVLSAVATN